MSRFENLLIIATWGAPIVATLLTYIVAHLRWARLDGFDPGDGLQVIRTAKSTASGDEPFRLFYVEAAEHESL